jgi:cytochrome c553
VNRAGLLAASFLALLAAGPPQWTHAEDRLPVPSNPTWKAECGACHLAYPPSLLPAPAWRSLMGRLDQHFGADASLDPEIVTELTALLERHAGRDRGVTSTNRITDTAWFRRKHRKVPSAAWTRADVKSAANCAACHPRAAAGDFDDDSVRISR